MIHVTVGTYERILHGFVFSPTAPKPKEAKSAKKAHKSPAEQGISTEDTGKTRKIQSNTQFRDVFLLAPHASSIRSLALSPSSSNRRYLATGGADERTNIFQLSATGEGKEIGTLTTHAGTVTSLQFCSHSKLLSTSLDNTLAVTRTKDFATLSTLRAPHSKGHRPEGDTYAAGDAPQGIVSVGVHPSQKLAVTVGIGERCMRLWDLVRGKKAGVLAFERKVLQQVGEGAGVRKGEGSQVLWHPGGGLFAIAFEKGVVVFDETCTPRFVINLGGRERVGILRWLDSADDKDLQPILVVATEQGRVLFFNIASQDSHVTSKITDGERLDLEEPLDLKPAVQLPPLPKPSRIKDVAILAESTAPVTSNTGHSLYVVTGSSNGDVHIFSISSEDLTEKLKMPKSKAELDTVGALLATNETGRRITCLAAFIMNGPTDLKVKSMDGADVKGGEDK